MTYPATHDDQQLLTRLASGDGAALGQLFDSLSPRIFGLAITIVSNRQDAEEVLQDTWLQVWRSAKDYDANLGSVSTWVLRITRSRAIDRLRSRIRSQARETLVATEALSGGQPRTALAADSTNLSAVLGGELVQNEAGAGGPTAVAQALAALPAEQREAIEMAFLRGLSREEIASSQRVAVGTVKTRIFLGLKRLRDALAMVKAARV